MLKRPTEFDEAPFLSKKLWSKTETRLWTATLFTGTCMLYASRIALPICAAVISLEYGWNKTDSGTILSCFFWGYAITQLVAGGFADAHGGERILPNTSFVWILLTIFTPQIFDFAYWSGFPFTILLIFRIIYGVAQGFHVPSMASIVSRHLTTIDKGKVFGFCLAGSHFGTVLAGVVGSLLLEWLGWRVLFQFLGVISLLWFWWFRALLIHVADPRTNHTDSDEETKTTKPQKEENGVMAGIHKTTQGVPWGVLLRHPAWWAAAFAQFTGGYAYFTMFNWLPSYFHENFPSAKGVVYNVVPSAAIVTTSMIAPFIATRLISSGYSLTATRRIMEGTSLCGCAILLLLVPSTHTFPMALLVFTLAMAARGLHHGGVSVNPHDFAPHHTGAVFGIFNAFGAITGFVGVYVAGHILEATNNNWGYVFVITAVQCILGAIVYGSYGTGNKII
ncbi:unnamed protein product, partial [Mesorhabditis belari]|uniref:Major facilitator superfamily (MFS) profile domain-containing protein n=1 Tax=Mesorhabditis belari TaxID=2138241 RepID=A0AAF3E9B9_9BILA